MNTYTLALASIRSRPLYNSLCITAITAGITLLCSVLILSQHISSSITRNAQGVDIVVGAKGSPLQLVLSSIYHIDIPTGNIDLRDYQALKKNPRIRKAIPIVLGDSYKGYRMVGTTIAYLELYNAEISDGKIFTSRFETVVGAKTGLKIGDRITVSHGFSTNNTHIHTDRPYTVTGVLKPTGSVVDKLLITDIESVQQLHSDHHSENKDEDEHHHHGKSKNHDHEGEHSNRASSHPITSILLKTKSPIDLMNMPRHINESSDIMAAVPAYEMTRLTKNLGIGRHLFLILGSGFVLLSMLVLWATLSSGLTLRKYDLAIMRVLGASPYRLAKTVVSEAVIISTIGSIIGVIFGHLIAFFTVSYIGGLNSIITPKTLLTLHTTDGLLLFVGVFTGILASFMPAVSAARTDVSKLLSAR